MSRDSREADFWTQQVFWKLLEHRIHKKSKFEKLDPLMRFLRFCQKWTKSIILKKAKNRASLEIKSMKNKPQLKLYAKNEPSEISQITLGLFLYFPILLYNTIWVFMSVPVLLAWHLSRDSREADFWTQQVFWKLLEHRIHKKSKFEILTPWWDFSVFVKNGQSPKFIKKPEIGPFLAKSVPN